MFELLADIIFSMSCSLVFLRKYLEQIWRARRKYVETFSITMTERLLKHRQDFMYTYYIDAIEIQQPRNDYVEILNLC